MPIHASGRQCPGGNPPTVWYPSSVLSQPASTGSAQSSITCCNHKHTNVIICGYVCREHTPPLLHLMECSSGGHSFQDHSSSTLQRGSGGSYHSVQYKLIHRGLDHYSGGDWASVGLARVERRGLSTAATHCT